MIIISSTRNIIESAIVSTPEVFNDNIPMSYVPYDPVKQPITSKLLRQFSEPLYVKSKTDFCRLCAAESKRKEIIAGRILLSSIPKCFCHTKINECVKNDI